MKNLVVDSRQADFAFKLGLEAAMKLQNAVGPEEGEVLVHVRNVAFLSRSDEYTTLKFCALSLVHPIKGLLPRTIMPVVLGNDLTWDGPVDIYVSAELTLHTNGHTTICSAKQVVRVDYPVALEGDFQQLYHQRQMQRVVFDTDVHHQGLIEIGRRRQRDNLQRRVDLMG